MTNGLDKFRKAGEKLKAEVVEEEIAQQEEMTQAVITLESLRAKSSSNVGMNNIGVEDIMPPKMFLVQGIKDKSELVDNNGNQCPDGKFYLKGLNEILDSATGYFVWVKRDEYKKEGDKWDLSKMYRTIFVRASDMLTISVDFNKSNMNALSDLFTSKVTQRLPLFVFKTEIKTMLAKNKDGISFFKTIVNVKGVEDDPKMLTVLNGIAERFDQDSTANIDQEVEELPAKYKEPEMTNYQVETKE